MTWAVGAAWAGSSMALDLRIRADRAQGSRSRIGPTTDNDRPRASDRKGRLAPGTGDHLGADARDIAHRQGHQGAVVHHRLPPQSLSMSGDPPGVLGHGLSVAGCRRIGRPQSPGQPAIEAGSPQPARVATITRINPSSHCDRSPSRDYAAVRWRMSRDSGPGPRFRRAGGVSPPGFRFDPTASTKTGSSRPPLASGWPIRSPVSYPSPFAAGTIRVPSRLA